MCEWDEAKRKANLEKHGLDFADAYLVYENPDKLTFRLPYSREERFQDLAIVQTALGMLSLVYTLRGEVIRVISFRPASRKERAIYEAD